MPRNRGYENDGDSLSDYNDSSSAYWPPAWDYNRWRTCPEEEIFALPGDEFEKLRLGFWGVLGEGGVLKLMELRFPSERNDDELLRIKPNWLVHYEERVQKDCEWGFVGFRMCLFDDEQRWEAFRTKLDDIVTLHMREVVDRFPTAKEALGNFRIRWVGVQGWENVDAKTLRDRFRVMESDLSLEVSRRAFLVATPDSVAHLLDAKTPTTKSKMWQDNAPYIVAVSTIGVDEMDWEPGHEELEWHKEAFKVAAEMVVDELWHSLEGMEWSVARITGPRTRRYQVQAGEVVASPVYDQNSDDDAEEIWWSISPSPKRMEKRRRRRFGDLV